ncbi:MAG: AbrB/MazE/SpoVT family DNA-binding domain-containing protein [Clostridiaceae bacterium]
MKSTGIVRQVDRLGRIVLPKELRDALRIGCKDPMAIYVEEDLVILKKYEPACVFCGQAREISRFKGKNICSSCLVDLSNK